MCLSGDVARLTNLMGAAPGERNASCIGGARSHAIGTGWGSEHAATHARASARLAVLLLLATAAPAAGLVKVSPSSTSLTVGSGSPPDGLCERRAELARRVVGQRRRGRQRHRRHDRSRRPLRRAGGSAQRMVGHRACGQPHEPEGVRHLRHHRAPSVAAARRRDPELDSGRLVQPRGARQRLR